jgi:hypothetical protein
MAFIDHYGCAMAYHWMRWEMIAGYEWEFEWDVAVQGYCLLDYQEISGPARSDTPTRLLISRFVLA